jgi:hypothetical protein
MNLNAQFTALSAFTYVALAALSRISRWHEAILATDPSDWKSTLQ